MNSGFRSLIVYKKAFSLAMDIFEMIKTFPNNEKYGLVSQIRNSSRSVCANVGEAYRKRRYQAHFITKLSDADMENTETQVWLDFALACNYIEEAEFATLNKRSQEIGKLLNFMIKNPEKYN